MVRGEILYSHSYRNKQGSLSHYPGSVGLPGTLLERPLQLLASFVDGFPAARLSALTAQLLIPVLVVASLQMKRKKCIECRLA